MDALDLSTDERHRLLAASARRHAIAVVADSEDPLPLRALAIAVVDRSTNGIPLAERADEIDRTELLLHHAHLPMLTEAGTMEYDPESKEIRPVTDP